MSFMPAPPDMSTESSPLAPRKVSFGEAISSFYKNYANFSGRASRSEFWYVALFSAIVGGPLYILAYSTGTTDYYTGVPQPNGFWLTLYFLFVLANFIPNLALTWRRLHDVDKSGGYYFILLIPIVGAILLLIALCTDTKPSDNRFGPLN